MNFRYISVLLPILVAGCVEHTQITTSGSYGPFNIGDPKNRVLELITGDAGIESIEPIPFEAVNLQNPSIEDMTALDSSDGILVWLDGNAYPLRIELEGNRYVGTWGVGRACRASSDRMNLACREIQRLEKEIKKARSRADIYRLVHEFDTKLEKSVGSFIVGYQEFRIGGDRASEEYKELLLGNDAWRFRGMRHLSKYDKPFYSRIEVYFRDGCLTKVTHWSSPHELL